MGSWILNPSEFSLHAAVLGGPHGFREHPLSDYPSLWWCHLIFQMKRRLKQHLKPPRVIPGSSCTLLTCRSGWLFVWTVKMQSKPWAFCSTSKKIFLCFLKKNHTTEVFWFGWFFWPRGIWHLSSATSDWTGTHSIGRWSLNYSTNHGIPHN